MSYQAHRCWRYYNNDKSLIKKTDRKYVNITQYET